MQKNWKHGLSLSLTIWLLLANIVFVGIFANQVLIARADLTAGKALSFDGADDYVEVPDSASLTPSEITIEAWIYPLNWTHTPIAVVIATKRTVNTNGYMFFWFATTKTITIDFGGNTQRWNTGYDPPLNTWTHLAYTFSGVNKGKFYVNGNLYATTTTIGAFAASTGPLRVGMDSITPQYWFKGSIDEVRIYNRPCTATEISTHYSQGIGEYGRPETGLSGLWHFDNDANDYSGFANNGTVNGGAYVNGYVPLPDVAVLNVSPQVSQVVRGGVVAINVTVGNVGAGAYEDFTVTLYGNSTVIDAKLVSGLLPQSSTLLTFTWDTTGFPLGTYTIGAEASAVQGETDIGNNVVVDGTVLVFLANPEAAFTYSPSTPIIGEAVTFNASTSIPGAGDITSYIWNFSDGTLIITTDQPTTLHNFTQLGTYNVTLTVVNTYEMSDTAWALVTVTLHDLAAIDILKSKTVVGQGFPVDIGIKIQNAGDFTENSNVTVYANQHIIYETTFTIPGMSFKTINFTLDTASLDKGNYVLGFIVWPVQLEANTTNNSFMGLIHMKFLVIAMQGDLTGPNGWPDGKVDIRDLAKIAQIYAVSYPDPRYNCDCDITGGLAIGTPDGRIDIKDLAVAAKNFGKVDP